MAMEEQLTVDQLIEELATHINECEGLYVNCKDCMFKVQRKDLPAHASQCDKLPRQSVTCNLCEQQINNGHVILHLQNCENAKKCDVCGLKYDCDEDLHH